MKQTQDEVNFEEVRDLNHGIYIILKSIIDRVEKKNKQIHQIVSLKWPNEKNGIMVFFLSD